MREPKKGQHPTAGTPLIRLGAALRSTFSHKEKERAAAFRQRRLRLGQRQKSIIHCTTSALATA